NLLLAKAIPSDAHLTLDRKANFMRHTSQIMLKDVFANGIDSKSFRQASDFVIANLDLITTDEGTLKLLEQLKAHDDFIYAHSLGVSTFSVMIARAMGWSSLVTLGKLAMGGLFHDIGNKEISPTILNKPRHMMTHKERHLLETHVTRGKEILNSLKVIPSD